MVVSSAELLASRGGLFEWAARMGFQRFFQPSIVAPNLINSHGWIDSPKTGDVVIDLYSLAPTESKTMYWFYESIVTLSTSPIRVALEGNLTWDDATGQFDPGAWFVQTGYAVSAGDKHQLMGPVIKTKPGEAIRLRIFANAGASNDIYFKFVGWEIPFRDFGSA